jgi:hypothetical protein
LPGRILRVVVAIALAAVIVGAVAFWLTAAQPSPEQAITKAILRAEEEAERGSVVGVNRALSNDYQDAAGYTRRDLARMIALGLRAEQWEFSVQVGSLRVDDDGAESVLRIGMWPEGAMAAKLDYAVTLAWRREGRAWRIISSDGWQGSLEYQAADAVMQQAPPGASGTPATPEGSPGPPAP